MSNTEAQEAQNNEWKERELGALWVKNGRSGDFLSGHCLVDGSRVEMVVFRNKNKTSDRAPDYILYKSKPLDQKKTLLSRLLPLTRYLRCCSDQKNYKGRSSAGHSVDRIFLERV